MQTILKYKLETTNEKLTPRTGVVIFGEYLKGLDFKNIVNSEIVVSKHHKAYNPFEYIYPLMLMLHSGGRVIDDIKEIRMDEALKTILKIDNIPTADAIIKYLHKMGKDGEESMRNINKKYLKRFLKTIKKKEDLILDIDATFIEAHKNTAKYSYLGEPGYMPMVGHINGGYVIDVDFRDKIKELKNGFNMSYLPTSNFEANSFYFQIGTLAYNLFLLFKQILDSSLQKHTVKTIRYKLYNIAGKVVSHAREWILKVNEQFIELLNNIRQRAYDVSIQ